MVQMKVPFYLIFLQNINIIEYIPMFSQCSTRQVKGNVGGHDYETEPVSIMHPTSVMPGLTHSL